MTSDPSRGMMALAIPMTVFYFLSILVGLVIVRRRRKKSEDDSDDDDVVSGAAAGASA